MARVLSVMDSEGLVEVELEEILLDDVEQNEGEMPLDLSSPLRLVNDPAASSEPAAVEVGRTYVLFLNDRLGSEEIYISFVYDPVADRPVAPFDQPKEGYATSGTFDEVLDCLVRRNEETTGAQIDDRLAVWLDTISQDPNRRGEIDIDYCLT